MKTILAAAALALVAVSGPALASAEAPVQGVARTITAPAFVTMGADGAPIFATATPGMILTAGAAQSLAHSAEAYVGKRG